MLGKFGRAVLGTAATVALAMSLTVAPAQAAGAIVPAAFQPTASASTQSNGAPSISCDDVGTHTSCVVSESDPLLGTIRIQCDVTVVDLSGLPNRVTFPFGTCGTTLTGLLDGVLLTIELRCSGHAGELTTQPTEPTLHLQLNDGTCRAEASNTLGTLGVVRIGGSGGFIDVSGSAVEAQVGPGQFEIIVPGAGIGLSCLILSSARLDPNAVPPVLIRPPDVDCGG